MRAHFDPVQCCAYRPRTQEVITCGADGLAFLWSAGDPPYATRASYISLPTAAAGGGGRGFTRGVSVTGREGGGNGSGVDVGRTRRLGAEVDDEDEDMWSSDDEGRGAGDGVGGEGGSSGRRGGSGGTMGRRREEGFVPPILMQEQRAGRDKRQDDTL